MHWLVYLSNKCFLDAQNTVGNVSEQDEPVAGHLKSGDGNKHWTGTHTRGVKRAGPSMPREEPSHCSRGTWRFLRGEDTKDNDDGGRRRREEGMGQDGTSGRGGGELGAAAMGQRGEDVGCTRHLISSPSFSPYQEGYRSRSQVMSPGFNFLISQIGIRIPISQGS